VKNLKNAFTLVEVLVAIVIGVISVAAAFSAYNYYSKSYSTVSQKLEVNSAARSALSIIAKDLRNAGYLDKNLEGNSNEGALTLKKAQEMLIQVKGKVGGKYSKADELTVWYSRSPKDRKQITYKLIQHKGKSDYYLAREEQTNPWGGANQYNSGNLVLVKYVDDFQVILKDKEGRVLTPVCRYPGSLEMSQGANTLVSGVKKCIHNQKLVHTAEVYLTVRSPKEIIKSNRKAKIVSGESGHGSDLTIPADKYHRDTYYVSVHTRNLAIPPVQSTSSVGSLGVGQGYNQ